MDVKKNGIKWIIFGLAGVAILGIILLNIIYLSDMSHWEIPQIMKYGIKHLLLSLFCLFTIAIISYVFNRIKIKKKVKLVILVIILIIYALLQIGWIHITTAEQFADSLEVIQIAQKFANNQELSEYQTNYLQYYPQQLTMAGVFTAIFQIGKTTDYKILEILNVISNLFTVLGLYAIVKSYQEKYKINSVLFFMLILTFVPMSLLVSFVYGDWIGLACSVWAIYFAMKYTKTEQIRWIFLVGILIAVACLVRMNYFIFAIAIFIYWLQHIIEKSEKTYQDLLKYVAYCVLLLVMIGVPNELIKSKYSEKYQLDLDKSFSTIPYLYMGISEGERANGWYNDEVGEIVFNLMNTKEDTTQMVEDCKQKYKERIQFMLQHPIYTMRFYRDKFITIWADPTMEFKYYNTYQVEQKDINQYPIAKEILMGKTYDGIILYQKGWILLTLLGVILAILGQKKQWDNHIMLLCLVFLGGFTFHLLWEAKSRYILPYVIILIPVSCIGITETINKLERKIKEKINTKRNEGIET